MYKEDIKKNWEAINLVGGIAILLFTLYIFLRTLGLIDFLRISDLILIAILIVFLLEFLIIFVIFKNEKLNEGWLNFRKYMSENAIMITIAFLAILFSLLFILYFFSPQQIILEPREFVEKIPAGDYLVKSFSIKYMDRSGETISISITEPINNWIIIAPADFEIESGQTRNINFFISIPSQTALGEYGGSIRIKTNSTISEIPVSLVVAPRAQFQTTIDVPPKINKSDYFKVKINIKNIGDSPVNGIEIRLYKNNITGFDLSELEEKKITDLLIDLPSKNDEFSTELFISLKSPSSSSHPPHPNP